MSKPTPWIDEENAACIALYFVMQNKAETGQKYNKAAMIREVMGLAPITNGCTGQWKHQDKTAPLANRSRPSIEMKLMNLSAVFESLGRDDLSMSNHGYRAMPNYQANLKTMAIGLLAVRDEAVSGGFESQA